MVAWLSRVNPSVESRPWHFYIWHWVVAAILVIGVLPIRFALAHELEESSVAKIVSQYCKFDLDGDWTLKLNYPPLPLSDVPATWIIRPKRLKWVAERLEQKDPVVTTSYQRLLSEANELLKLNPPSVVSNQPHPPSGDPHDYMSFGPYWWPNPDTDNGMPYIRRDGIVNPDARKNGSDRPALKKTLRSVETLALAYHFSKDKRYSHKAVELLQVFFLDSETRMNPNLNFGQAIPGRVDGRAIGIIDTRELAQLVDSIAILSFGSTLSLEQTEGLKQWLSDYLDWLVESDHGREESTKRNNHGTYYDVQTVALALFTGRDQLARSILLRAKENRLGSQIEPDGKQPEEFKRTIAFSYAAMNLHGLFHLARLGEHLDVDLWQVGPDDTSLLLSAIQYLIPYVVDFESWPYEQIRPPHPSRLRYVVEESQHVFDNFEFAPMEPLMESIRNDEKADGLDFKNLVR